jgi:hypothetical protein
MTSTEPVFFNPLAEGYIDDPTPPPFSVSKTMKVGGPPLCLKVSHAGCESARPRRGAPLRAKTDQ